MSRIVISHVHTSACLRLLSQVFAYHLALSLSRALVVSAPSGERLDNCSFSSTQDILGTVFTHELVKSKKPP